MNRTLIFDLWGSLGHFKKPYTTTSPLSFSFPPRPTIAGMISAIIGLDKKEYLNHFKKNDANIALKLEAPAKKIRISQNLIDTKKARLFSRIRQRTQIRIEYLKDPKYRIYFQHKDKALFNRLKAMLEEHGCVFTISLGLSELLADFEFIGEFDSSPRAARDAVSIHSVAPGDAVEDLVPESGGEYFSETVPMEMNSKRIVTRFGPVFYEKNGKTLRLKTKSFFKVENGENILFL